MNLEIVDCDIFKAKPSTQVLICRNWKTCQDIQTMRFGHFWLRKMKNHRLLRTYVMCLC